MSATDLRADHCGSFIRPERLRKARLDHLKGQIDDTEFKKIEDESIVEVLEMQKATGLEIFTDGEFRRAFWMSAISPEFFEGMESRGYNKIHHPDLTDEDFEKRAQFVPDNPVVTSKIRLKKRIAAEEIAFLKKHSPGRFKVTIPSPVTLRRAIEPGNVSKDVYPNWNGFVEDYTGALTQEIGAMIDDGVTYLQLDAPGYIQFFVPGKRERLKEFGIMDAKEEFRRTVEADNKCLRAARKPGVVIGVHICLGTYILGPQGPLGGAGGDYDASVLGQLVEALDADRFLIEYSERSGTLDSLRMIPKNKTIVLGILNIRDPRVESVDEIMRKTEAASRYVPMENLALSPNCGFSGASAGAFVTEDIQRRKLEAVVEASRRLWNA